MNVPDAEPNRDRHREIHETAARIFFEKGYAATSMNDLATALNLTKAGLYHYIDDKETLLFNIIDYGIRWVERNIMTPGAEMGDPEQRLEFIIDTHVRIRLGASKEFQMVTDEDASLSRERFEVIARRRALYVRFIVQTLEEMKSAGRLRDLDCETAALFLIGSIKSIPRWYVARGPDELKETRSQLKRMLLYGLLPNQPAAD